MKKLILFLLFLPLLSSLKAQEIESTIPLTTNVGPEVSGKEQLIEKVKSTDFFKDSLKKSEHSTPKTTFIKNSFGDNWFISLSGGGAYLRSEETNYRKTKDGIVPTFGFSVGKWLSPLWGARLNVTGATLKGFASWDGNTHTGLGSWYIGTKRNIEGLLPAHTDTYLDAHYGGFQGRVIEELFLDKYIDADKTKKGISGYEYDVKYMAASMDVMLNLTNLFSKYNPDRFFNLTLFAGIGYAHTFGEDKTIRVENAEGIVQTYNARKTSVNNIMEKFGLQGTFRLGSAVTLDLEPQLLIVPEKFDRRVGDGNTMDGIFNLMVGLTYKFKDRYFYEPAFHRDHIIVMNNIINTIHENCCEDLMEKLKEIELALQNKQPVEKEHLNVTIHFVIDKHEVRTSEMYKLEEISKFMHKYPQVRVSVAGYADVKTAYPEYNMKLSERRANEVVKLMTVKYGIDKSRFRIEVLGDTVQPFSVNEMNRAVIAFDIDE